jgi:hypothetical protein
MAARSKKPIAVGRSTDYVLTIPTYAVTLGATYV